MDYWKADSLTKARRACMQANNLCCNIADLENSLLTLGGYADDCVLLADAAKAINGIVQDLFELEGELSRTK